MSLNVTGDLDGGLRQGILIRALGPLLERLNASHRGEAYDHRCKNEK